MGRESRIDKGVQNIMAHSGGNGGGPPRRLIFGGPRVPIIGQSKSAAKLAKISYIQILVVGGCSCGGDIVIENYTRAGKCSSCKSKYWVNVVGYQRSVDEEAINIRSGARTRTRRTSSR
jgi:hypothetical protein